MDKYKGKFNNSLIDKLPIYLENMFDRSNNDWGEFRKAKKDLKEKIVKKEMTEEIRVIETGENIDYDIPKQEEILEQVI